MIELGQLERSHPAFADRKVRVVAISNDDLDTAKLTQADFPHLMIVSDADMSVAKALDVIHPGVAPGGKDTNAPTTFFLDGTGKVRRFLRPKSFMTRYSPQDVLAVIDEEFGGGKK